MASSCESSDTTHKFCNYKFVIMQSISPPHREPFVVHRFKFVCTRWNIALILSKIDSCALECDCLTCAVGKQPSVTVIYFENNDDDGVKKIKQLSNVMRWVEQIDRYVVNDNINLVCWHCNRVTPYKMYKKSHVSLVMIKVKSWINIGSLEHAECVKSFVEVHWNLIITLILGP